jgi:sec-independent protein translocase protein TatB
MDIGMSELLVIGIVALIVIGPRDLPEMFRQLGRMTAKMRNMAREFNRAMEQAANETGVKDVAKDLKSMTSPTSLGLSTVKGAMDKFEKWDPIKNAAKPTIPAAKPLTPAPMPATPVLASAPVTTEPAILPPAVEAVAEVASVSAPAPAPTPAPVAAVAPGPATAALYEKKAAREAILAESAAKLKALDEMPVAAVTEPAPSPTVTPTPAKPARRKKTEPAADGATPPPVAKAPRKKKAVEE